MRKGLVVLFAMALVATLATPAVAKKPAPDPIAVLGPFGIGSPEADALEAELAAFTTTNRVEIIYEDYFSNAELVDRVTGADPPDLIISPQPATLAGLAPELVDLAGFVNPVALRRDFGDYLIDLATVDGAVLGGPIKADLKSLVWYRPAEFEAAGYAAPETFNELVALSDSMVADGRTPWCNYIESGFATGWIGTDWVEDLLLGAEGPAVYDEWVDHTVLFTDARVETAFQRYQQMIDTAGYVFDRVNMANIFFFDNAVPLGGGDCMMHKQGTFFAFAIEFYGFDIDDFATFRFPSVDPAFDDTAMGGGQYLAALNDRAKVRQLTRFMLSQRFGREALAATGGWLLPNIRFDTARYPDDLTRSWADIVQSSLAADQFRFDASDLMPPEVGTGSFWAGIVDLVEGLKAIPQVLGDIDASWPT